MKGTKVTKGGQAAREQEERASAKAIEDIEASRRLRRHYDPVVAVGVDADQVRMHSVDKEGYVITWSYSTRLPASRKPGRVQRGGVTCAAFEGGHVAYGFGGGIGVWDLRKARNVRVMKCGEAKGVVWGQGGRRIYSWVSLHLKRRVIEPCRFRRQ